MNDFELSWPGDRPLKTDELERALERLSESLWADTRPEVQDDYQDVIAYLLRKGTGGRTFASWRKFRAFLNKIVRKRRRRRGAQEWQSVRVNPPELHVVHPGNDEPELVYQGLLEAGDEDEPTDASLAYHDIADPSAQPMLQGERVEMLQEILAQLRAEHNVVVALLPVIPTPSPRRLWGKDTAAKREAEMLDRTAVTVGLEPVGHFFYPEQNDRETVGRAFELDQRRYEIALQIARVAELLAEEGVIVSA